MTDRRPTPTACRAAAQLGRTVNRAIEETELTPAAYRLLAYLSTGSTAATVLADKLAVSRPTITVTTDWLEARGLVVRTPDPDDRRRVAIVMTDAGAVALADADERIAERLADVLDPLDDDDATAIVVALDRLMAALNEFRARRHDRHRAARGPAA